MQSFDELKLSPEMARSIVAMGFTVPTPIQAQTLPILLGSGTDFLGMAATGTGKTVAFGIPLIERMDTKKRVTQALVLCPTRELALQVTAELKLLGQFKGIDVEPIYGGTGYGDQLRSLRQGTRIIVATPGRLVDHLRQGALNLKEIRTVVLDEADEMISMGFKEDLEALLGKLPKGQANIWCFSATMSMALRRVANQYLQSPKVAHANREEMLSGTVKQLCYTVRDKNKPKGLCRLIDSADDFYGLIFCQTKALVTELTGYLTQHGYKADCLHGDKVQRDREKTLQAFRSRETTILVASDVAARGLDVKELTHVVNYSLPNDPEVYVHRIGRTARSGKEGLAISLVGPEQMYLLARVERLTRSKIEIGLLPGKNAVNAQKLSRLLSKFGVVSGHEKALLVLGEDWGKALKEMTGLEIAARFLSLMAPTIFEDREKADELEDMPPSGRRSTGPRQSSRFQGPRGRRNPTGPSSRYQKHFMRSGDRPGDRPDGRSGVGSGDRPYGRPQGRPYNPHSRRPYQPSTRPASQSDRRGGYAGTPR